MYIKENTFCTNNVNVNIELEKMKDGGEDFMRKKIIGLLLATMTMTSLVGCGSSSANSTTEEGGTITIKMLSRYSSDQGPDDITINKRIEEFMAENTNIIVEHEAIGDESTYNNMFKGMHQMYL